jgi:hypothetical protein
MTATADPLAEVDFSAESYKRHADAIPSQDGFTSTRLELRLSGTALLDRTSRDDVALLEAARLGEEVLLLVRAEWVGKGFTLRRVAGGERELGYAATVRVVSVEAGEAA